MTEDEIRQIIEEIDPDNKIDSAKIEELVAAIKEREIERDEEHKNDNVFYSLYTQMQNEVDWRKKAVIAAKIISAGL